MRFSALSGLICVLVGAGIGAVVTGAVHEERARQEAIRVAIDEARRDHTEALRRREAEKQSAECLRQLDEGRAFLLQVAATRDEDRRKQIVDDHLGNPGITDPARARRPPGAARAPARCSPDDPLCGL
jgi:uncharacterized membrane protein YccC